MKRDRAQSDCCVVLDLARKLNEEVITYYPPEDEEIDAGSEESRIVYPARLRTNLDSFIPDNAAIARTMSMTDSEPPAPWTLDEVLSSEEGKKWRTAIK